VSTYIDGATVHLDDIDGHPATIPARHLHVAARYAVNNDAGVAQYGLHVERWLMHRRGEDVR